MPRSFIIFLSLMFSVSTLAHDHEAKECDHHKTDIEQNLVQDNSWIRTPTALKLGGATALAGGVFAYIYYKTGSGTYALTGTALLVPLGIYSSVCICNGVIQIGFCHHRFYEAVAYLVAFVGAGVAVVKVNNEINQYQCCHKE